MNTDVRLDIGFWEHPKTIKLIRRLGLEGPVALQKLWLWATQNRPDGVLSGMDVEDIEIAAKWNGEPTALYAALTALGFVDTVEGTNILHNWKERNSWQSESELRSGKSRLSRLARSCPDAHKALIRGGRLAISEEEYSLIRSNNDRTTIVQRILNDRSSPFLSNTLPSKKKESLRDSSCPGSAEPDEQPDGGDIEPPKSAKKKPPAEFDEGSEPYRLALFMRDTLRANVPTLKEPNLQSWAKEFDIALRNDGRMHDARFVAQVIKWACSDGFWKANIQSPGKLREKFDQLTAKMEATRCSRASPAGRPSSDDVVRHNAEITRRILEG